MEVTGGEDAAGGRRGCLAAILGPSLGVVTVEVVVVVPAPARRRAGTVGLFTGAVVVVAVVTGRVLVDVTGRGWLGVVVVVGVGAVPVPATGGRLNRFNASSTLTG